MKKKFWRCHVCNDLHWGVKPPEFCPTCRVKNAYVEVAAGEARALIGSDGDEFESEFGPEDFRRAIAVFAEPNDFRINPDEERVTMLVEGVFENERNHGLKYCPCRLCSKNRREDIPLICPCNFPSHETYRDPARGECWCGLFIRR